MSYDETHVARLKDIKVLGNRFNSIVNVNNAEAHNSHPRVKNLGATITAQQLSAIRNSSFADLYPGDYWNLPIDGTTRAQIMHLNYWNGVDFLPNYSSRMWTPHAILLLSNGAWKYPINDTDTTEGGLASSKMWTEYLPEIFEKVKAVIGEENIFAHWHNSICDSVDSNTGLCNHRITVTSPIWLPSAAQVLSYNGSVAFTHAGTLNNNGMWAYFSHFGRKTYQGSGFWLDTPYNLTRWCSAHEIWSPNGNHLVTSTSGDWAGYVCPYILLSGVA